MTDLEINKHLALAIGWKPEQITEYEGQDYIGLPVVILRPAIKLFSYKFWNVIGPIAERYDYFPYKDWSGKWDVIDTPEYLYADTPQKAIALAVIEGVKK